MKDINLFCIEMNLIKQKTGYNLVEIVDIGYFSFYLIIDVEKEKAIYGETNENFDVIEKIFEEL